MPTKRRQKAPARGGKTKRTPAKRRMSAGFFVRLPTLEQHEVDLIGLFLVAVGVFLACVLYLGWNGGTAGTGLADGVRFLVGTMAYAMPIGLVAAGALIVFRPLLPAGRPFGIGGLLLLAGMTLAFAAGTFGLGPEGARADLWTHDFVAPRGGVLGEALYSVAHPAIQA